MKYKKGMRAVVDLGSKGYKLEIYDSQYSSVHKERIPNRMGLLLDQKGKLTPHALNTFGSSTTAIRYLAEDANKIIDRALIEFGFPKEALTVVATAASRNLANSPADYNSFVDLIRAPVRLLSANDECRLGRLGFLGSYPKEINERVLYVDLGGASTEISISSFVDEDQTAITDVYSRATQASVMHAGISLQYGSTRAPTSRTETLDVTCKVGSAFSAFKIDQVAISGSAWSEVSKNVLGAKTVLYSRVHEVAAKTVFDKNSPLRLVCAILDGLDLGRHATVVRCKGGLRLGVLIDEDHWLPESGLATANNETAQILIPVPKERISADEYDKGLYKVMADYANKYERAPS